ncbi:hypothetical protein KGF57_003002 [Candida theae]|uniref:Mitochondrial fusion and transport protein UGO1 n=1 Tax=Candida theae TaxID=1198502 RepID=A0AAD5BEQ8_9ASCO|nr:uncharacterized protein KGF57_003002 [Candida theae]KAI5957736.1 hypothetical protein KGF57_003002 [Candida theae]
MTSNTKLGPEQLRPYYDHDSFDAGYSVILKKGVGLIDTKTGKPITANLSSNAIEKQVSESSFGSSPGLIRRAFDRQGGVGIQSNKVAGDKNFISDLEFSEYFEVNNMLELLKNLFWTMFKDYVKVLLAQPLEITRLVLQVGKFNFNAKKKDGKEKSKRLLDSTHSLSSSNASLRSGSAGPEPLGQHHHQQLGFAEQDEPIDYFQPQSDSQVWANPNTTYEPPTPAPPSVSADKFVPPPIKRLSTKKRLRVYKIQPKSLHTIEIMSAIANKDSFLALFRGVNASYLYQVLTHMIEAYITGFVSPFLGIPDPFFLDLTHSNDPFKSLWLSVSACVLTGLVMIPLDLIRVKFMITQPTSLALTNEASNKEDVLEKAAEEVVQNTRSFRESIRNFPTYYLKHPPTPIIFFTTLYQLSTSVFRKMAPYLLYIKFNIDAYSSPTIYTFVNLLSSIGEFFVKLPVENLLRKEQVRFLLEPKVHDEKKVITIVKPEENMIVEFNGVSSSVDGEELTTIQKVKQLGLFNGWRVGLLNVVGFWGYNIFKNSGNPLQVERL